jgi:RimJ/RimL family protein N-acetyltransferase
MVIRGSLVRLRPRDWSDTDFYADRVETPEGLGPYMPEPTTDRAEVAREWSTPSLMEGLLGRKFYVAETLDGRRVGHVEHYVTQPHGQTEIGYAVVPEERGKGYCTEAVRLLVGHIFGSLRVERIQASTDVRNTASIRVLEKNGFKLEGTLRHFALNRGEWTDYHRYSILHGEWENRTT